MRNAARFAYRWIGPTLFLLLVWFTDLSQVNEIWRRGSPSLLAAAAGLNAIIILIKAWRWRRLMLLQGIEYNYAPAARYYAIGCALAAWTPGRLGDFSKALAVHRDRKVGLGRAASSVIADRLMDAVVMATFAAVGAFFLPGASAVWLAITGLGAAVVAGWLLFRTTRTGLVRRSAVKLVGAFGPMGKMGRDAGTEVGAALDGLVFLVRPAFGLSAVATALSVLVTFLQGFLVARSLGIPVGFWTLSVALSAVSITSLLPVTVAGFGTREGTLLLFLSPMGVGRPEVVAFSLAYFLIISGSLALMGAAAWVMRPAVNAPAGVDSDMSVVP